MKHLFLLFFTAVIFSPIGYKANELNFEGLSEYSANDFENNTFSNIIKNDWSFKALNKLAKNRDCNFITRKSDSVSSRESFTRHEAALIIKTCLKDVVQTSTEEKRLLNEFNLELKSIKNRFKEKELNNLD